MALSNYTPTPDSIDVPINAAITFQSDGVIDPDSLSSGISVNDVNGFPIALASVTLDGSTVIIVPDTGAIEYDSTYTVVIDGMIEDGFPVADTFGWSTAASPLLEVGLGSSNPGLTPYVGCTSNGSGFTKDLNSAYTYASNAGTSVVCRFVAPCTGTLDTVHFPVTNKTGSPGDLTVEVRGYNTGNLPGGTVLGTEDIAPSWVSGTKWQRVTFSTPIAVTAGTAYFVVIAGKTGTHTGSHYWTVRAAGGLQPQERSTHMFASGHSSSGANTPTIVSGATYGSPTFVLGFTRTSDSAKCVMGNPYTTSGTRSNNSRKRGVKIGPMPDAMYLRGALVNYLTNASKLQVFEESEGPGGTVLSEVTIGSQSSATNPIFGVMLNEPVRLEQGKTYRVVVSFSGNSDQLGFVTSNGATQFATVRKCLAMGGLLCDTIDDGSSGWTDSPYSLATMALLIESMAPRYYAKSLQTAV